MHKIIQQVKTKPFPIRGEKTGLFNKLCWNMQLNMGRGQRRDRRAGLWMGSRGCEQV